MVEIREAPVPVLGWFWPEGDSREHFIQCVRYGWDTSLSSARHDVSGFILSRKESAMGLLLSNNQVVIVRAKK